MLTAYKWNTFIIRGEPAMDYAIIVEGKNDKSKLKRLLQEDVHIYCTFGTPSTERLEWLRHHVHASHVYIFTDNDSSGKKIRRLLSDVFQDAEQIYTRRGYPGVEHTPLEYLIAQLEKAGLEAFIRYEALDPAIWKKDEF